MPTILEKLKNAGLPVIEATEDGKISTGPMTETQNQLYNDIILEHFNPAQFQIVLETRTDKAQIKAEYQATLNTLSQIENTATPTNTQIIAAVKFMAKTLKLILKLLTKLYKN